MVNKVKIARIQMDLTQQQLVEQIGVTRQKISLVEKGKYNPTLNLCLDFCYVLNKTLDELFWIERKSTGDEIFKKIKEERLLLCS